MKTMVLGCALTFAAVAASAAPAQAMDRAPGGFSGSASGPAAGSPFPRGCFDGRRGDRHHRQGGRCAGNVVLDVYGGEWALYNNRTWEADSYNDWWHDRPDRAFPRWVQHNENCERLWWSGGGWRC